MTDKLKEGTAAWNVYRALRGEIEKGELAPDERIPTEKELCERFKKSRVCVRQALKALLDEELIVTRQGSGSYVKPVEEPPETINTISVMCHGDMNLITSIQNMIFAKGRMMSLFSQRERGWEPELERFFLEQVKKQRHEALIASCTPLNPTNADFLEDLTNDGIRVVHIEPFSIELPKQEYLLPDYERAGYAGAVSLMLGQYDRIAFLGGNRAPFERLLVKGFERGLRDQNYAMKERFVEVESIEKLNALIHDDPERSVGVFSSVYVKMRQLEAFLDAEGIQCPEKVGMLSIELIGENILEDDKFDYFCFDRLRAFEDVIESVTRPDAVEIRKLIDPKYIKKGSIR